MAPAVALTRPFANRLATTRRSGYCMGVRWFAGQWLRSWHSSSPLSLRAVRHQLLRGSF